MKFFEKLVSSALCTVFSLLIFIDMDILNKRKENIFLIESFELIRVGWSLWAFGHLPDKPSPCDDVLLLSLIFLIANTKALWSCKQATAAGGKNGQGSICFI